MSFTPKYPDFTETEFRARILKAKEVMKKRGLDALFLSQFVNVYYFSSYQNVAFATTKDWPYVLILSANGDIKFIERGGIPVARGISWIPPTDVIGYRMVTDAAGAIKQALLDLNLKEKRVGAELGQFMSVNFSTGIFLDLFKSAGVEFVDGADAIWDLREVKSPLEVDRIREAAKIASVAAERGFSRIKAGMTERDVSRLFSQLIIEEGGDFPSWTTIIQSGDKFTDGMGGTFPSTRKISVGEYVQIDFGAVFRHYNSDLNRIAIVGKQPSQDEKDHWNLYVEANKKGTATVKPGVTAEEVFRAMEKVFAEGGVKYTNVRAGHGLGLDPHEPPHLGIADQTVLKPGMVFAIEPFGAPSAKGVKFNCEDDVLCTETGSERLSSIAREIFVV